MDVRLLDRSEVPRVREIALATWIDAYRDIYSEEECRSFVAEYYADSSFDSYFASADERFFVVGDPIIGYAHIGPIKDDWELHRIYVDPNAQGRGVGRTLLEALESYLRERGIRSYRAHPQKDNLSAIAFYERMGFSHDPLGDREPDSPCYRKML